MTELINIILSDAEIDFWPKDLKEALLNKNKFKIEIESEHKLKQLSPHKDFLFFKNGKLTFQSYDFGEMCFDFEPIYSYHLKKNYSLKNEPIAKALGIKGLIRPLIWDTTCGTGKDSLLIKSLGGKLLSFERHPAIYLLLQDAQRRFPVDFSIEFADPSRLCLEKDEWKNLAPEVIYYDPMYEEKKGSKKSALPRKEMRIFKNLIGADIDSEQFLNWALKTAKDKVVVKRPLNAPFLHLNPTASYKGKSTRYDMYKILN